MKGLEGVLSSLGETEALAAHLARMAETCGEPKLAAWLHVEQARLLTTLGKLDVAW